MTLGIALCCPSGAVLLTDSMITRYGATGRVPVLAGKIEWHAAARIAFISSGYRLPSAMLPVSAAPPAAVSGHAFQTDVRDLFHQLTKMHHLAIAELWKVAPTEAIEDEDMVAAGVAPQVLAAGGPIGTPPIIALLQPRSLRWGSVGDVYLTGGWTFTMSDWIRRETRLPAPPTLEACKAAALRWARGYVEEHYGVQSKYAGRPLDELVQRSGFIPAVWPPYNVASLTASEALIEKVAA